MNDNSNKPAISQTVLDSLVANFSPEILVALSKANTPKLVAVRDNNQIRFATNIENPEVEFYYAILAGVVEDLSQKFGLEPDDVIALLRQTLEIKKQRSR